MFPLRHAAVRLLTSRSVSIATRSRTITSFTAVSVRQSRIATPLQFQRRWATSEAEAQKEEAPVSTLQPTPEEEVENAIHEDNATTPVEAAPAESLPETAESANLTDTANEPSKVATESFQDDAAGAATAQSNFRQPSREPAQPKPTIYVGNLFFDVTENDLAKEFGKFGAVKNTRLIRDSRGLSKGFGYLTFENTEQAQAAVDSMNQQVFEGRRLAVNFAHTDGAPRAGASEGREFRPVNPPSKTLFIGNMSFEMTDRDLNNLFRGIRNVIDVRVAIDRRTGQPRGFAHADFVDVKSAMEAMKTLSGKENYGRKLRVDYSFGPSNAPRNQPR